MHIAPSAIALATGGAEVTTAALVLATDTKNPNGEFCKVLGVIHPVDQTAPDITFEINLPTAWNGKAMQFGGGGYNGSLVTGLGNYVKQLADTPTALKQGYVTLGSDSGHVGTPLDASFALNAEALVNFAHLQIKKTKDVGMAIVKARYGSLPAHMYFSGGSQGGHEGFDAAQRYPADYDGVIVGFPAYNFSVLMIANNAIAKALYANNGTGWLNPHKATMLASAVYAVCDALDGVSDGIISNIVECRKATATFKLQTARNPLRCATGADTGDTCLSDAQIDLLNILDSAFDAGISMNGAVRTFAKWTPFEGSTFNKDFFRGPVLGTSPIATSPPAPVPVSALYYFVSDGAIRYFITQKITLNSITSFDPFQWAGRINQLAPDLDATNPDLTAFSARGGKMILFHGTADDLITPYNTIDYYDRVVGKMGQTATDSFLRFYLVHGMGHHTGVFNASMDSLSALEAWVEKGQAPSHLVAVDTNAATLGRTRPVCLYPQWPKYNGFGNVNVAASFSCVRQ